MNSLDSTIPAFLSYTEIVYLYSDIYFNSVFVQQHLLRFSRLI